MAAKYGATYPAAMKCLLADRDGLTAYLRFPAEHHHRIRHSNFIERTFGETRRRVKVIGRLPGETSCLTLVSVRPWSRPRRPRLAWPDHDLRRTAAAAGSAPLLARTAPPAPAAHRRRQPARRQP